MRTVKVGSLTLEVKDVNEMKEMNKEQKDSVKSFTKRLEKFHQSELPIDGFQLQLDLLPLLNILNPTIGLKMKELYYGVNGEHYPSVGIFNNVQS